MRKTTTLNLANLRDLAESASLYLKTKGQAVPAEFLISDVKHYLESFLNSFPEEFHNNIDLPVSYEDTKLRVRDRVKIIGTPILRPKNNLMNYIGKEAVILDILDNGNYWVGLVPSITSFPFFEIEPSSVEYLKK